MSSSSSNGGLVQTRVSNPIDKLGMQSRLDYFVVLAEGKNWFS